MESDRNRSVEKKYISKQIQHVKFYGGAEDCASDQTIQICQFDVTNFFVETVRLICYHARLQFANILNKSFHDENDPIDNHFRNHDFSHQPIEV